jgi:hypothetical protein
MVRGNWLNFLIGLWFIAAPFVLGLQHMQAVMATSIVGGLILVILGAWAATNEDARRKAWIQYVNGLVGVWFGDRSMGRGLCRDSSRDVDLGDQRIAGRGHLRLARVQRTAQTDGDAPLTRFDVYRRWLAYAMVKGRCELNSQTFGAGWAGAPRRQFPIGGTAREPALPERRG